MNTQIINAELQQALRQCLPFVRRHAIVSGGDGSLTYAFALRALADADARQQEEQRVKNIVEAERARECELQRAVNATIDHTKAFGHKSARAILDRPFSRFPTTGWISGVEAMKQAASAVRPGEGYLPVAPPAKGCDCDTCVEARLRGIRRAGL